MNFRNSFSTLAVFTASSLNKVIVLVKSQHPNVQLEEAELNFRVASQIEASNSARISGIEGMWCFKDRESYERSGIPAKALKRDINCGQEICHCGDVAGNPCAAQIVVDKDYGAEDAFDKRMCNGCIYKLKLLDIFDYEYKDEQDIAVAKKDVNLYIKFYKAIDSHNIKRKSIYFFSENRDRHSVYEKIVSFGPQRPIILLETRAMVHLFKDDGGCITAKGLMIKMKGGTCRDGRDVPYPTGNVDFSKCNPNSDGTIGEECEIELVKEISKQIFRAYISKTQYGCFTNFRLLPREYFVESGAVMNFFWPCNVAAKNDEIRDDCGGTYDEASECIARFRGLTDMQGAIEQNDFVNEEVPHMKCGNCYVIRLWTEAFNPLIKIGKYHKIKLRVKVYGKATYKDGGNYKSMDVDYRIPKSIQGDFTLSGINRDVELLWEPVKNGYKNLCRRGNCRLCVDKRVSSGLNVAVSDSLRKEINLSDYSFKKGGSGSDGLNTNPTITDEEGKLVRPFKHFIHMDGEEFGTLNYEGGENGDKCGMAYVEWEYVCFESGANLRFKPDQECGQSAEIRITKGGDNNVTANIDAFAATMMLLIGTENLDGDIVGPCDACNV